MKKLAVFSLAGCLLTGCIMNSDNNLNEIEKQSQLEMSQELLQSIVDTLLLAASENKIAYLEQELSKIDEKQLDKVLVNALLQMHKYRYEKFGDAKLLELLLKAGADPNSRVEDKSSNEYGYPATMLARNVDTFRVLIEDPRADFHVRSPKEGADPNEESAGIIPLYHAIEADWTDGYQIIKTLIQTEGIDLNIKNEKGLTPREYAKQQDYPYIVKILEEYDVP